MFEKESEGALRTWSARAIHDRRGIDLLHDRQRFEGDEAKEFTAFANKAVKQINRWSRGVAGKDYDILSIDDAKYHARATPNGSYGYIYIRIWEDK